MKVRRGFIHVKVSREHVEIGVAFPKTAIEFVEDTFRKLTVLSSRTHIFHIADLENDFVKGFLLFAGTDFFIVVVNAAVLAFLLGVVFRKGCIEQIVICLLNGGVGVFDIQMGSCGVYIL